MSCTFSMKLYLLCNRRRFLEESKECNSRVGTCLLYLKVKETCVLDKTFPSIEYIASLKASIEMERTIKKIADRRILFFF